MSARATTRRFSGASPRLIRRSYEDVQVELQEFLEKLLYEITGGIPAGFSQLVPPEIIAGDPGDAGSESDGWMSGSARAPILTAAPSNPTGKTPSEGTSGALMRADATVAQGIVTTKGDILTDDGVTAERLPVGVNGQILVADSAETTGIKWSDPTTDALIIAIQTFMRHLPRIPQAQAGAGVTIGENALGPVISATVSAADLDQNILANRIFGG